VVSPGTLTAVDFYTESGYDLFSVTTGGVTGPSSLSVAAGSTVTFTSDNAIQYTGWVIQLSCAADTSASMLHISSSIFAAGFSSLIKPYAASVEAKLPKSCWRGSYCPIMDRSKTTFATTTYKDVLKWSTIALPNMTFFPFSGATVFNKIIAPFISKTLVAVFKGVNALNENNVVRNTAKGLKIIQIGLLHPRSRTPATLYFLFNYILQCASATSCTSGYYSSTGTDSSGSCTLCSTGYFSTTGATSCAATLHDFDFRGCTTGASISDAFSYTATPYNGPTCSSYGMYFDGVDDYLAITGWLWGGATSFEAFVNYQSYTYYSRVFEFSIGSTASDNVVLSNDVYSNTGRFFGKV